MNLDINKEITNKIKTTCNEYNKMNKDEKDNITFLFIINCIDNINKGFNKEIDMEYLVQVTYHYYLNTELQIDKICHILIEYYEKLINDNNFDIFYYMEIYN